MPPKKQMASQPHPKSQRIVVPGKSSRRSNTKHADPSSSSRPTNQNGAECALLALSLSTGKEDHIIPPVGWEVCALLSKCRPEGKLVARHVVQSDDGTDGNFYRGLCPLAVDQKEYVAICSYSNNSILIVDPQDFAKPAAASFRFQQAYSAAASGGFLAVRGLGNALSFFHISSLGSSSGGLRVWEMCAGGKRHPTAAAAAADDGSSGADDDNNKESIEPLKFRGVRVVLGFQRTTKASGSGTFLTFGDTNYTACFYSATTPSDVTKHEEVACRLPFTPSHGALTPLETQVVLGNAEDTIAVLDAELLTLLRTISIKPSTLTAMCVTDERTLWRADDGDDTIHVVPLDGRVLKDKPEDLSRLRRVEGMCQLRNGHVLVGSWDARQLWEFQ